MSKFDISKYAETLRVSESDTSGREQIEYIDIDRIDDDPRNFYQLSDLEELAANIELLGLQQPLRVRPNPEDPERVILVSGHRRRAAIRKLVEEGREALRQIPCIREPEASSAALQELRLIYANSDTRKLTPAEVSRQAERVEELLYQLKEEGMEFPGRMRDHVAAACKISGPKLARLKVIREKLTPEYMELFEQDKLPEQTAYTLARLPADFQKRLALVLSGVPNGHTAEKVLQKYEEGWRWEPDLTCPDGKVCKRGDAFLRRDCEASYWASYCGGYTCCLECDQAKTDYSPCERMCSKAKAQRKTARDEAAEKEHRRKQKTGRKYQGETQGYARRLLRAIDAAGLTEDVEIPWRQYGKKLTVSRIRRWAAGEFDDPAGWYSAELCPERLDQPSVVSRLLGCSTDFLLGLTDDLRPAAPEPDETQRPEESGLSSYTLDEISQEAPQARIVHWENRGRTPPEGKLILTYQTTNDGPQYCPAVWTGSEFKSPNGNGSKRLNGLQYTHWFEVPAPYSGEAVQLEQTEGQLVIAGWMPGGTLPPEPCDVVADFRCGEGESAVALRDICWFDGQNFLFSKNGAKMDAEFIRWMRLPPVMEA